MSLTGGRFGPLGKLLSVLLGGPSIDEPPENEDPHTIQRWEVISTCAMSLAALGGLIGCMVMASWMPNKGNPAVAAHGGAGMGELIVMVLGGGAGAGIGLLIGGAVGLYGVAGSRPDGIQRCLVSLTCGIGGSLFGALLGWFAGCLIGGVWESCFGAGEGPAIAVVTLLGSWVLGALAVGGGSAHLLAPGSWKPAVLGGVVAGAVAFGLAHLASAPETGWLGELAENGLLHGGIAMPISLLCAYVWFELDARTREEATGSREPSRA